MTPTTPPIDVKRLCMIMACSQLLEESSLGVDDLQFLFVILTMALAMPPAKLFERLRTSAASNPVSDDR